MTVVIRPVDVPKFPAFTRESLETALVEAGINAAFEGNGARTPASYLSQAVMGWLWELRRRKDANWREDLTPEEIASGMREISQALFAVAGRIQNI